MKILKSFEEYLQTGIVQKQTPDRSRAGFLTKEAGRKMDSLKEKLEKIGVKDENANDYAEYCYDIMMLLIRAKLYAKGYHASGSGAHEAEVSYLRVLGFNENEVQFADKLRYFRNGMLYYGTRIDREYAQMVLEFTKKNYPRMMNMLQN